ncbi:MAG: hypothetical protein U0361_15460 [Nitrospiraceae bacterium]
MADGRGGRGGCGGAGGVLVAMTCCAHATRGLLGFKLAATASIAWTCARPVAGGISGTRRLIRQAPSHHAVGLRTVQ